MSDRIEGVEVQKLKIIKDNRGAIHKMMEYTGWGEIYYSRIYQGVVKAWHYHKRMTLNYACVYGSITVVLVDLRPESPSFGRTEEWVLDDNLHYKLMTIPPRIWNGFRITAGFSYAQAILANCASMVHDPEEIIRVHPDDFPVKYDWGKYRVAG